MKSIVGSGLRGYYYAVEAKFAQLNPGTVFLFVLLLGASFPGRTSAQTTYYSIASSDWNDNNTWSLTSGGLPVGVGIFPVAGDDAIIEGGFTVTVAANAVCNNVTISNSSVLTISSSNNLTVSGDWVNDGAFTAATGAVTFDGASQTIGGAVATTFHDVSLSGSATVTTAVDIIINGSLSIGDGTTLTAAGFDFTVGGATTVGGGTDGSLIISLATGAKTFTGLVTIASGGTWNNTGDSPVTFQGGITNNGTFTAGSGAHTFDTNAQALSGTLSIPSLAVVGVTLTNNNSLTVSTDLSGTGGLKQASGSTLNLGGTSEITSLDANTSANTVNYSGSAQSVKAVGYSTLELSGSDTKIITGVSSISDDFIMSGSAVAVAAAALTIGGDVTLGSGTDFTTGAFTHNVGGNWINNGTTFTNTGSTINFNAGSPQNIGGSNSTTFNNLALSASGTKTFGIATFISGNLSITGASVNLGAIDTHTANTLILASTGQSNGTWGSTSSTATYKNDAYFIAPNTGVLTVAISSCTPGTWMGTTSTDWNTASNWCGGVPTASTNVVIPSGGNQPTISAAAVCNDITINSGAALVISGSNSLTVSGNWTNDGAFTANTSTVTFNGVSQSIGGTSSTTFYNVATSGSTSATAAAVIIIGGNLSVGNGTIFTVDGFAFTVNGTTTVGGGSSGQLIVSSTGGTKTFGGLVTVASGGTWNNSVNSGVTFHGGITNNGTFTAGSGTHTFNTSAQALTGTLSIPSIAVTTVTLTNNNTLTVGTALSGTGGLAQGSGATLSIGGTSTITTLDASTNTNTVNYTGTGAQTMKATSYSTLNINGSSTKTTSAASTTTVLADLTVNGGVTLRLAGASFNVNGSSFVNGSVTTFTSGAGTKTFSGLVTINTGGVWNLSGQNPATSFGGGITMNGTTFNNGNGAAAFTANQSFLGTGSMTFGGNVTPDVGSVLTNSNSGTVTIDNLVLDGDFIQGSNSPNLTLSSATPFSGAGTFDAATNANLVTYSGPSAAVRATTYQNLTISGSGTAVLGGMVAAIGNLSISGTVVDLGVVTTHTANTLMLGGTAQSAGTWGSTSSTAANTNDGYFLAPSTGIVTVATSSCTIGTWIGTTSTDWHTASNWCGGVPTLVTDVVIPSGGNQPTISAAALCNNITLNSGAFLTISGSNTLTVSGNWANNGGALTANTSTVTFNGSGKTIGGTTPTTFYNVALSGSATVSTAAAITIGGNIAIGDGTTFTIAGFTTTVTGATTVGEGTSGQLEISSATGTKTFNGLITVAVGGTWTNTAANSTVTFHNGITNNGTFSAGTGVHTFNTNNQSLTGTLSIPSVTVTGVTLTNNNTLTVATALSGTGGLTQASNATLNIGTASVITTLDASTNSGNTVNYTGAGQTVHTGNYQNLGLSGSGAKAFLTGTTSVGGNLTLSGTVTATTVVGLGITGNLNIGDGTTFTAAGFALTVTGTTSVGGGTSGQLTISAAAGTKTFNGLVIIASGGTWTNATSPVTFHNGITNSGTFSAGTGIYTFDTNAQALTGTFAIPSVTVSGITLTNNNSLTVATALSGSGGLTQGSGSSLSLGGTHAITSFDAATNTNTVTYTGASAAIRATTYSDLTISGAGSTIGGVTVVNGIMTVSNTVTNNSTLTVTTALSGASTLTQGTGSTLNVAGTSGIIGLVATANPNTVNYAGTAQTVKTITYNNLTFSGSGIKTAVGALTVTGTITLGSGIDFTAGAFTHNVAGNWINNGATFTNAGSTINFNGTTQSIGGSSSTTFNHLTLSNSGTKSFSLATFIGGNFSISGTAVADLGTNTTHTTNALFLIGNGQPAGTWGSTASSATYKTNTYFLSTATGFVTVAGSGCSGFTWIGIASTDWHTTSNWCNGSVPTALDNVIIPLTANQPVISAAAVCNDITINSSAILTISGANSFTVSGNFIENGTFTPGASSTVIYNGAAQTAAVASYQNLTLSGSGAKSFATTPTVNGTLSLEGTASVGTSTITYGASATLQYNKPAAFTTTANEWITPFGASGGIIISNTGVITMRNANVTLNSGAPLTINAGATLETGNNTLSVGGITTVSGTFTLASTAAKTFTGDVTINAGAIWNETGVATINFGGSLVNNASTFTANTGTHNFTFNGSTKTLSGSTTTSIASVVFSNNASYTNNGTLICTTLLQVATSGGGSGTRLTNNGTITASTALSGNGGVTQGTTGVLNIGGTSVINTLESIAVGNFVNYTGATQTVKATTYHHLTTSGSGTKTAAASIVNGNLTIGDGTTFTSSSTLTVYGATTVGGGASGAFSASGAFLRTFENLVELKSGSTWTSTTSNLATLLTFKGGITLAGTSFVAGGATFNTNTQTVTGSTPMTFANAVTVGSNVTLSGTGTVSFAASVTVSVGATLANDKTGAVSMTSTGAGALGNAGAGTYTQGLNSTLNYAGSSITVGTFNANASGNSVNYTGSVQTVRAATYYNLLVTAGANVLAASSGDVTVNNLLTVSNGTLNIQGSNLTLGSSATITLTSPSATKMIIASANGEVRKYFPGAGSFIYPIGDNLVTTEYSPVTIDVTTANSTGYVGVRIVDYANPAKNPSNFSTPDFLSRDWVVTQSGISGCQATVTGTYLTADINGTETNISAGQLNGTFNQLTNGWIKYAQVNDAANTLTATAATLSDGQASYFTGITKADPTVSITGGGVTICNGSSVGLTTNAGGLATFAYSWSPTTGLSSSTVANPTASPTTTTTYTVTAKDANGISVTANTTITVNPGPTITSHPATQSACLNSSITLSVSATATSGSITGYQWYSNNTNDYDTPSLIPGETNSTYSPSTASLGTTYYYCVVTQTNSCTTTSNMAGVSVVTSPDVSNFAAALTRSVTQGTNDPYIMVVGDVAEITVTSTSLPTDTYIISYSASSILQPANNHSGTATMIFDGTTDQGTFETQIFNTATTDNVVHISSITPAGLNCPAAVNYNTPSFETRTPADCYTIQSFIWHNAATWNCGTGDGDRAPEFYDNATIKTGHSIEIKSLRAVHHFTLEGNGSMTNNESNAAEFVITGNAIIDGTVNGTFPYSFTGSDKTIDGTGNFVNTSTPTVTGDKTILSTATLFFNGGMILSSSTEVVNNGSISINENLTGTNLTSIWTNEENSTLNVGGTGLNSSGSASPSPLYSIFPVTNSGILNASAEGNTVNYYTENTATSFYISTPSSVSGYPTYYNLIISGGGSKSLTDGTIAIDGDLTLYSTLNGNGSEKILRVRGDWVNSADTDGFTEGSGTVIFDGTADQSITKTAEEHFNHFTINKVSGALNLNADVIIGTATTGLTTPSTLTMTSGNINTGDYTLTLGKGSESNGIYTGKLVWTSGNIIGEFERYILNATYPSTTDSPSGQVLFPVGTATYNRPVTITSATGYDDGSLIAEFHDEFPGNNTIPDAGMDDPNDAASILTYNTFRDGYWSLTPGSITFGASTFDLTLTGNGFTGFPDIDNSTRLLTRGDSGSDWGFDGNHVTWTSGEVVKRSSMTVFGEYAFGDDTDCTTPTVAPTISSGAEDVCNGVLNSQYVLSPYVGTSTYEWDVTGDDQFTNAGGSSVEKIDVDWSASPTAGSITVFERTSDGCAGPGTTLEVDIQSLAPGTPAGSSDVPENSDGLKANITYSTGTDGFYTGYSWNVTGGTIISGNNTSTIQVQWGDAGTGAVSVSSVTPCGTSQASTKTVSIYNLIFSESDGTWNGNQNSADFWSCDCVPTDYDNIFVKSGHNVTLGADRIAKNVIIAGTLNTGANELAVTGHLTFIEGGTATISGTGDINLNSGVVANPTIDGTGTISNTGTFNINASRTIVSTANITKASGSVSIAAARTATNNGIMTLNGNITGSGTWTNAASSRLNFGGTSLLTGGTFNASATDNTVEYTAATTQAIRNPATSYYHLIFSGAGEKTAPTAFSISGDLTNNGTATTGTWVGFNPNNGTVSFIGTADQNIYGVTTFYNLTTNKSSGSAVLQNDIRVNGLLSLTAGNMNFSDHTLFLDGSFDGSSATNRNLTSNASSTLSIGGTGSLSGSLYFSAGNVIGTFTLNRTPSGSAALGNSVTVSSGLNLTNGALTNSTFLTLSSEAMLTRTGEGTLSTTPLGGPYNLTYNTGTANTYSTAAEFLGNVNNVAVNVGGTLNQVAPFTLTGLMSFGTNSSFDTNGNAFTVNSVSDIADLSIITDLNGSIGQIQNGQFFGQITAERYMGDIGSFNRYVSSPVTGAALTDLTSSFAIVRNIAQVYDESVFGNKDTKGFKVTNQNITLASGKGYLVYPTPAFSTVPILWDVTGPLTVGSNQKDVNLNPKYTVSVPAFAEQELHDGWNLMGNPYPSGILWDDDPAKWTMSNIDPIVHVTNMSTGGGVFMTYDFSTGLGTLPNGVIATGQAFWVKATAASPTLIVHEAAKSTSSQQFFRKSSKPVNGLEVSLSNGSAKDASWLLLNPSATLALDVQYDRVKWEGETMSVSFETGSETQLMYSVINEVGNHQIPVTVKTMVPGTFTINFEQVGTMPEYNDLFLVDTKLGNTQKISDGGYVFTTKGNEYMRDRFYITAKPGDYSAGSEPIISVFPNPMMETLEIKTISSTRSTAAIVDMNGAVIAEKEMISVAGGVQKAVFDVRQLGQGVYLVRTQVDGKMVVRKVVKL
jgi:hypothetical protein